jgi:hypothetical protein
MGIVLLSRWAANQDDVERLGRKAKPLFEKHGAEFQVSRIFSGANTGQFLVEVKYIDWERFGRAMYAMAGDAEYQDMLVEANRAGQLQECSILTTLDMSAELAEPRQTRASPR